MNAREADFLRRHRVAHFATADDQGRPLVVPICFAFDGERLYTSIDEKPKTVEPGRLRRLRNLEVNPNVAVVVDDYDEDWSRLAWVLVRGRADLVSDDAERARALELLREKYPQYRTMDLESRPLVRITPERVSSWDAI